MGIPGHTFLIGFPTVALWVPNSREGWPCCRCGVLAVTVVRSAGAGLYIIAPVRVKPTLESFSEAVQNARTFRHAPKCSPKNLSVRNCGDVRVRFQGTTMIPIIEPITITLGCTSLRCTFSNLRSRFSLNAATVVICRIEAHVL